MEALCNIKRVTGLKQHPATLEEFYIAIRQYLTSNGYLGRIGPGDLHPKIYFTFSINALVAVTFFAVTASRITSSEYFFV